MFALAGTGRILTQPDQSPREHFWLCDTHDATGAEILTWVGMQRGEAGCVMGGPPCQGFSRAGKQQPGAARNMLVFQFGRLVLEIQPATMVMENVPGILNMVIAEGIPVLDALARVLADGGLPTYNALRNSLASMQGAAGAVRDEQNHKANRNPARDDSAGEQPTLFEAVS